MIDGQALYGVVFIGMWGILTLPIIFDVAILVVHSVMTFTTPLDVDKMKEDELLVFRYNSIKLDGDENDGDEDYGDEDDGNDNDGDESGE